MEEEIIKKLNSLTKYPSILTYHKMGEKGILSDEIQVPLNGEEVIVTEKVDGTNGRIIMTFPHHLAAMRHFGECSHYFIGSREELLYAEGDILHNPALDIVEALRPVVQKAVLTNRYGSLSKDGIITAYFEVYGGKLQASRQYTKDGKVGIRLFDINICQTSMLDKSIEEIAAWRDNGGQQFLNEIELEQFARHASVQLTPRLGMSRFSEKSSITNTYAFMCACRETRCGMDVNGNSEGIVIRTQDRSKIAKLRFEDYRKTLSKAGLLDRFGLLA